MAKTELFVRRASGGVFTVTREDLTTGSIFFVNSVTGTDAAGYGNNPDSPLASINYAVTLCTADANDRIYVMPGHVETVVGAAGLALNIAGVEVIGLGRGADRPKVNFTTSTAATMVLSAANCRIKNLLFAGGIDALVAPLTISGADNVLEDCEWRDVTGQATDVILTTAGANRLLIKNWRHDGDVAAGTNAGIAIVGGDGIVIDGVRMDGNFAVGCIDVRTTPTTDLEVRNAYARNRNASCIFLIDTITGSTGLIGPNIYVRTLTNGANITETLTGATFVYFPPVYIVNNAGEMAMASNITASTDA
jgi:hypothetical protein